MQKIKEMFVIAILPLSWLIYTIVGTIEGTELSFGEWWEIC